MNINFNLYTQIPQNPENLKIKRLYPQQKILQYLNLLNKNIETVQKIVVKDK